MAADNEGGMCKVGFSGDDTLRAVIPPIVDKPKMPGIMVSMDQKDCDRSDERGAHTPHRSLIHCDEYIESKRSQYEAPSSDKLQDTIKGAILAHNPQDPECRRHVEPNATRLQEWDVLRMEWKAMHPASRDWRSHTNGG